MDNPWRADFIGKPHDAFANVRLPKILTFPTSIQYIADTGCSIARFGDGEFGIAFEGAGPQFQKSDPELQKRLRDIAMSVPRPECAIGLARPHFYNSAMTHRGVVAFVNEYWAPFVKAHDLLNVLHHEAVYIDACLTIPRHHYDMPENYWRGWFETIAGFFAKRNVILVTGDAESAGFYRYAAHDVRMFDCPSVNAWADRERIKAGLLRLNRNREYTVVLQCGPAATALAWELADDMQVLDLGHLGKEYEWYKRGKSPTDQRFYTS